MAAFRTCRVTEIIETSDDIVRAKVDSDNGPIEAIGWPRMLGSLSEGDRVVVNTTGLELDLGTGGAGFILWNLDGDGAVEPGPGHIMKMRYTPWQTEVLAVDAPESAHHERLKETRSIAGMPVVVCGLHSQVAGAVAGIKAARPAARIGYLMTDGAALPIGWSDLVRHLRRSELLDITCTSGHAFGGELEVVNVYSGLVALREIGEVDAVVVAMGPGVVGTDTVLGFTGIEQGPLLDAVTALEGAAIACLRISFVDQRERHLGISHHSLTTLALAARERCTVVMPELRDERQELLQDQLRAAGIYDRHDVVVRDGGEGLRLLASKGLKPSSMGRTIDETPELFVSASAAGAEAASRLT
ncbi:MAG: hypothetical protein QOH26_2032 [Actinomycetota bacterium]|nr:hypothetical protein [Actinomycetota bacterium]